MNSAAFDEFGRMTANLGLEAVPATPAGQNILLYPYIAPPTEVIDGTNLPKGDVNIAPIASGTDGTQIWKITHNGVDTHPIHFHLFNVQLLNRVTWDNIIIPTEPSELGWKETIRVSPLEDTIVAVRPITPTLPFEVPNSIRPLSPMMPLGANLDPTGIMVGPNGQLTTITNALVNFGWEYVYHCHILSHEEMDMMRPVLLALPPIAPGGLVFNQTSLTSGTLTFNDNSFTETSFLVQKSLDGTTWTDVPDPTGAMNSPLDQPNVHGPRSLDDTAYDPNVATSYRVVARNTVGATDALLAGGYSGTTVQSVSPALLVGVLTPTTTTLTSDVNPSTFGQNVTFTATVAATTGIPTGTVQFSIGGTNVGAPVALNASGVATLATSTLSIASHSVEAVYFGSTFYDTSLGTLNQVVNKAPSTTALTSSLNPSFFGQSVTFTATVGPATATGTVVFNINGLDGAPVALVAGKATFTTTTLPAGDNAVIATYLGDANYLTSNATLTQVVSPLIATTTTLTSSPNPSVFGQSVTFTATVSPVAATGTVVLTIDGVAGAPIALNASGVATFATTALTVGNHAVVAMYGGNATYATSASTTLTQVVNKATTTTTVRSSDTNGSVGDTIRLTATTTAVAPGAGTRTGTVEFKISNGAGIKVLAAAVPVPANGVTVFSWTLLASQVGTWTVTATYSGDANFAGSLGTLANQRVR
ncbi:MAG TPA: Ig-like domain repeat protein [Candidatus Limnocylindrales bacterium]|nr:Ig-like domain repeat protein [Candidatus Limnocylindrales bacterium]